ncbi:MAG: polyamine aminopropyltransferase [Firmicutes bacterium]|nr:polyamine aminopropyltransferase [Bacillota bacterium]
MQLWVTEKQTDSLCISFKVKEILHQEQTEFQHLAIVDTEQYGRMLLLDGVVQTTIDDEFVYHEMMAHVPMLTHPEPKKVAVIGGGDGGSIRELLKHPSVEEATLVEIDGRVIEASKEFLPEIAAGLSDPRVKIIVGDGIAHIAEMENYYDVILIDSTDPVGAAFGLFTEEFYANVYKALTAEGIMVAQTESPFVNQDIIERSFRGISQNFPVTELYLGCVPTYPGGLWSFTLGSKKHHPLEANWERADQLKTKYYTKEVHRAAFQLPPFVQEQLDRIVQK